MGSLMRSLGKGISAGAGTAKGQFADINKENLEEVRRRRIATITGETEQTTFERTRQRELESVSDPESAYSIKRKHETEDFATKEAAKTKTAAAPKTIEVTVPDEFDEMGEPIKRTLAWDTGIKQFVPIEEFTGGRQPAPGGGSSGIMADIMAQRDKDKTPAPKPAAEPVKTEAKPEAAKPEADKGLLSKATPKKEDPEVEYKRLEATLKSGGGRSASDKQKIAARMKELEPSIELAKMESQLEEANSMRVSSAGDVIDPGGNVFLTAEEKADLVDKIEQLKARK